VGVGNGRGEATESCENIELLVSAMSSR